MDQSSSNFLELAKKASENVGMTFKYAECFDLDDIDKPATHRVMCKGKKTKDKWVWLGDSKSAFEFKTASAAKAFVKEIKKQQKLH